MKVRLRKTESIFSGGGKERKEVKESKGKEKRVGRIRN